MIVDQAQSGRTLDLPVGQVLELRLAENPTTGYRWAFVTDGAPTCVVLGDRFEACERPARAGRRAQLDDQGREARRCDIAMQYRRSFQPDAPAGSFALHIRVTQ